MIGSRLGSYEIHALAGRGGMGEVYRARDSKLKRTVAIKMLPSEFSQHHERLQRFQVEAEALAALNHPNIAAIYALEKDDVTADGQRFLLTAPVGGAASSPLSTILNWTTLVSVK